MRGLVIDCAVAGAWSFRDPWDSPKQGKCVRVAYQAFGDRGVFEEGVLISLPSEEIVCTGENEERGGITWEGLKREGFVGDGQAAAALWKHLEQAELVVTFTSAFHINAFRGFAHGLGIDLERFTGKAFYDVMLKATPLAKVPWPSGKAGGRQPYKSPSLEEAFNRLLPDQIPMDQRRALARATSKPVKNFGQVQVRAVGDLYRAITRPPTKVIDAFQPED